MLLAWCGNIAWGQCCSGGVPIAGNLSLPAGGNKVLQLQLTYDYNRLRDLFNENQNLQDQTRQRSTHSSLLEISYGLDSNWSIAGLFAHVAQERIIETIPGRRDYTLTQGLGDFVLLIRRTIIDRQDYGWSIGIGPKIPTGSNERREEDGSWVSADLQPGSGAWDLMFWSSFSAYHLLKENLSFNLMLTGRMTSSADRLDGLQQYEFGNEWQVFAGLSDRYVSGRWIIDPLLMFRYRVVSPDLVNDFPLSNTGGQFIHFVPGMVLSPNPKISFRISSELPIFRYVDGTQLATSQKLTVGLFFRLAPQSSIGFSN